MENATKGLLFEASDDQHTVLINHGREGPTWINLHGLGNARQNPNGVVATVHWPNGTPALLSGQQAMDYIANLMRSGMVHPSPTSRIPQTTTRTA